MTRPSRLIVLFAILVAASASADTTSDELSRLAGINRALAGHSADITLDTGETLVKATQVVVTVSSVSWRLAGKNETLPRSRVARITTRPRSRVRRAMAYGTGLGAAGGAMAALSTAGGGMFANGEAVGAAGALVGAVSGCLIGAAIGSLRGRENAQVVYEASGDRVAESFAASEDERDQYLRQLLRRQRPD